MNKTIEIVVQPDGQTRVETQGFTGGECQQASRFIEESLGKRTSEHLTAEFYTKQTAYQQQEHRP